jgi:hypothetical protein
VGGEWSAVERDGEASVANYGSVAPRNTGVLGGVGIQGGTRGGIWARRVMEYVKSQKPPRKLGFLVAIGVVRIIRRI